MVEITRHFTASVYIVYNNKVLLHVHKKLNILLPPGGHLDRDELPIEGAYREVKEECGVNIEIQSSKKLDTMNSNSENILEREFETNVGEFCNVHFINPHHQHIDFVFIAKALNNIIKPQENESENWYWFTKEEIENHTKIKPKVKKYALFALENIKN